MSFILDALRKLEEKRAPETTRELLGAGVPSPGGQGRVKPLRPYLVTAALTASLLAAAGWFALEGREGGVEGEHPSSHSSGKAGEGRVSVPHAPARSPGESDRISAPPAPSLPDTSGPSLESPPPEGEPAAGKDVPESAPPSVEVDSAPPSASGVDGPVEAEMTASPEVDAVSPGESASEAPLRPLHELPEEIRGSLKDLRIEGHVYSDDPAFRLLSIDGSLRREGETVRPGLVIETISPDGAVFTYRGYRFSMKGY